ncbi:hypothetical protein ACFT2C_08035 [Promicromonospora sp. NPDC057138]|uniref:DUF7144 family membrane protein n=1 Tax=Promicromonospora sp. NPDC057138 TaxID=3346031 RepID=UPI003628E037
MTGAHSSGSDPYPGMAPVAAYGPPSDMALTTSGFAGTMLIMVALFQILQGIAAVAKDTVYLEGVEYTYQLDVTSWGWIHIGIGALALATGIGILAAQTWAYIVGIALAAIASIANFAFIPYYPIWSIIVLAFNVAVIWSLCLLLAQGNPRST